MFTGIVQYIGTVKAWKGKTLLVTGPFAKTRLGDSVAVEGACLTVTRLAGSGKTRTASFDLSDETLEKTTLGSLKLGQRVNLESALRVGDALGGHFVSGHVEGTGTLLGTLSKQGWMVYKFRGFPGLGRYLITKGSVAVDGVSLTVVEASGDDFIVAVIPHTETHTTLSLKKPGDRVNLEADLIAKHVSRLMEMK
jgi:riboflavin synthase